MIINSCKVGDRFTNPGVEDILLIKIEAKMHNKCFVTKCLAHFVLIITWHYSTGFICSMGYWACFGGYGSQCIDEKDVCDIFYDCKDGSDEDPAMCAQWNCTAEGWKCPYGTKCIDRNRVCDGSFDCTDDIYHYSEYSPDEDLAMCAQWTCSTGYWKCQDEVQCINENCVCDSQSDCFDKSDENSTMCSQWTCPANYWKCQDGLQCISDVFVCNGERYDCRDGSDEDPTLCTEWTCPDEYWKCLDGLECLAEKYVCDGETVCLDGSDENPEMCFEWVCSTSVTCRHGTQCYLTKCADDLQCTHSERICDDRSDCRDGSDEMCNNHCLRKPLQSEGIDIVKKCEEDQNVCVAAKEYCDGIAQCPDASDEICTCEKWGLVSCSHGNDTDHLCLNAFWASERLNGPVPKCQVLFHPMERSNDMKGNISGLCLKLFPLSQTICYYSIHVQKCPAVTGQ